MFGDFCEPELAGYIAYGVGYCLVAAAVGALVGLLARNAVAAAGCGTPAGFTLGRLVAVMLGALGARLLVQVLYGACEAAAWGLAPGGAVLALTVLFLSGLAGFLVTFRKGRQS